MVVEGSRQETLDLAFVLLGIRQQAVPVILRELVLPDGFDSVSPSFTVRDVTTDKCQIARNLGPGFPVDYFQLPSDLNIVHAISNQLDK
ncbi:unnamed protein product [Schistosoma margrebowiei]|uniref:Uncharacterized protein n=1 Tax=Schistosoma margrebowiei TaxID=48269 RepID=A0A183LBD4_9TREM|nr:unnamed protein product [Schistosoma margrebowiei]